MGGIHPWFQDRQAGTATIPQVASRGIEETNVFLKISSVF
jgi:hypothetical protein